MIDIQIFRDAEGHICGYSVAGHWGKHGSSIVCAGISVLAQSALKGIGEHLSRSVDFHVESGDLRMRLKDKPDALTDAILETMLIGMKDVQGCDLKGVRISEIQEV